MAQGKVPQLGQKKAVMKVPQLEQKKAHWKAFLGIHKLEHDQHQFRCHHLKEHR